MTGDFQRTVAILIFLSFFLYSFDWFLYAIRKRHHGLRSKLYDNAFPFFTMLSVVVIAFTLALIAVRICFEAIGVLN